MKIKCWGTRGSIPVSGKNYLKYGGDTTCFEIRSKNNTVIIIDAGSGIRKLGIDLSKEGMNHVYVCFTHAHWDHLLGLPFFNLLFNPNGRIEIVGCPFSENSIKNLLGNSITPPYFPIDISSVSAEITYNDFETKNFTIDTIRITPIYISHPDKGLGYKFEEDGKVFVLLTDNSLNYRHEGGQTYQDYVDFCKNADLVFHDCEYVPKDYPLKETWGHSLYTDVVNLGLDAGVKEMGFIHHDPESTDEMIDQIVKDSKILIKRKKKVLDCFAVGTGMQWEL